MVKVACSVCGKHEAKGVKLFMCNNCKSVSYCNRECQRTDWKTRHKMVCSGLNTGDAQQIFRSEHEDRSQKAVRQREDIISGTGLFKSNSPDFSEVWKLFFDSKDKINHKATVKKIKRLFKRQTKHNRQVLLFQSLSVLLTAPSDMLELPTSPLNIALQYADPNIYTTSGQSDGQTPLHWIAMRSAPHDQVVNKNLCILGTQLLAAGANVNARAHKGLACATPLHIACESQLATNLDLIKLLLDHGADPNATDSNGWTPLHCTIPGALGAAKFLLEYSDKTDPNIVVSNPGSKMHGRSFLAMVRFSKDRILEEAGEEDRARIEFLVGQLSELEEILVERGAVDIRRPLRG